MNEIVLAAAAGIAVASLLVACGGLWAVTRLRRHHRQLAASYEEQQRQLQRVAEQARDQVREAERRGERALAERFASAAASAERRDRLREALDEVLTAAATGRLDAQPAATLVARLQDLDREVVAVGPH